LIQVKIAIATANQDKEQTWRIFAISELKALVALTTAISCNEDGESLNSYAENEVYTIQRSQMQEQQKEKMVKDLQNEIDMIQEEMEKFNWKTEVEVL
jgi:hypothetical protein